jgi:amino acid permease-like protein
VVCDVDRCGVEAVAGELSDVGRWLCQIRDRDAQLGVIAQQPPDGSRADAPGTAGHDRDVAHRKRLYGSHGTGATPTIDVTLAICDPRASNDEERGVSVAVAAETGVYTTAEGLEEKSKLQRHFRRIDMLLFTVCALVGLDTLGQVSGYGASTFSWLVLLAIFFLFPYALIMAELGTTFAQEGGPYEWMKLAWGRAWGGVGSVLYWITNPLWVGGSLAFLSTTAWSDNIHRIGQGTVGDYAFKLIFIWISIIVAIVSLRRGKWIPNLGAIVRIGVLVFFSLTVVIYAIEHGVHGHSVGDFNPFQLAAFLGLVPLLLFNYRPTGCPAACQACG